MIEHTPLIAKNVGGFIVSPFYLISFFAFIVASVFIVYFMRKRKDLEYSFMVELLIAMLTFGIIFTLLIPRFLEHNFSSLRGIIIVTLFVFFYVSLRRKSWRYIDVIALATPLFYSIARLSCFVEWHCYGVVTSLPWGISVDGALPVHPTQIYLSLIHISLFAFLLITRKSRFFNNIEGNVAFTYLAVYSFLRLVIVEPIRYGVGTPDGFLRSSLLMLMFVASFMMILIRNRPIYTQVLKRFK